MKFFLLVILLCSTTELFAQSYKVSVLEPVGGYMSLPKSAPSLTMPWGNPNENYSYISIPGFKMNFFGLPYTLSDSAKLGVSVYGNLKIEDDTSVIIIDGYFIALDSTAPKASVVYQVSGEVGKRVVSIEWRTIGYLGCNDSSFVTFKMNLEEQTGNLVFDYGENIIVCDSVIGKNAGPYVGLFRSNKTFDKFYKISWLSGNPSSPKVTGLGLPALGGIPPVGKSYALSYPVSGVSEEQQTSHTFISYDQQNIILHILPMQQREAVIYDEVGKVVDRFSIPATATRTTIPTQKLARGTYLISIDGELQRIIY